MLSQKLLSVRAALGELLGTVDNESADLIRNCRQVLEAAEYDARQMEQNLRVPGTQEKIELKEVA